MYIYIRKHLKFKILLVIQYDFIEWENIELLKKCNTIMFSAKFHEGYDNITIDVY